MSTFNDSVIICDQSPKQNNKTPVKMKRKKRTYYESPLNYIQQSSKRYESLQAQRRSIRNAKQFAKKKKNFLSFVDDSVIVLSDNEIESNRQERRARKRPLEVSMDNNQDSTSKTPNVNSPPRKRRNVSSNRKSKIAMVDLANQNIDSVNQESDDIVVVWSSSQSAAPIVNRLQETVTDIEKNQDENEKIFMIDRNPIENQNYIALSYNEERPEESENNIEKNSATNKMEKERETDDSKRLPFSTQGLQLPNCSNISRKIQIKKPNKRIYNLRERRSILRPAVLTLTTTATSVTSTSNTFSSSNTFASSSGTLTTSTVTGTSKLNTTNVFSAFSAPVSSTASTVIGTFGSDARNVFTASTAAKTCAISTRPKKSTAIKTFTDSTRSEKSSAAKASTDSTKFKKSTDSTKFRKSTASKTSTESTRPKNSTTSVALDKFTFRTETLKRLKGLEKMFSTPESANSQKSSDQSSSSSSHRYRSKSPTETEPKGTEKNEAPPEQSGKLREIVIDGNNVAMAHKKHKGFSEEGLILVVDYFRKRGHSVKIFIPQFRYSPLLEKWYNEGIVVYTPSRRVGAKRITPYDDRYILEYATLVGAIVITSDHYRDLYKEKPEWRDTIEKRLLAPTFVGDFVMFPEDPLGRNGPKLKEFLRYSV